jgi:hypothetical protein
MVYVTVFSGYLASRAREVLFISPHVLYGCETWSIALTEEHRWKVFENGVLRRVL